MTTMKTMKTLITKISDLVKIKTSALPRRLSATIRVAVDDLEKVENSKKFRVNMGDWFSKPRSDGKCQVCFAGAVMAKTLNVSTKIVAGDRPYVDLNDFKPQVKNKLQSLNAVRTYAVEAAVKMFYGDGSTQDIAFTMSDIKGKLPGANGDRPSYQNEPDVWKYNMRSIARRLEEIGL